MGTGVVGHSAKTHLHILTALLGRLLGRFPKAQPRVGNFGLTEDLGNSCEGEREREKQGKSERGWVRIRAWFKASLL